MSQKICIIIIENYESNASLVYLAIPAAITNGKIYGQNTPIIHNIPVTTIPSPIFESMLLFVSAVYVVYIPIVTAIGKNKYLNI